MKFRDIILEGTWAVPDTLKKAKKLVQILNKPLLKKYSDRLYDLIGDDDFYDNLNDTIRDNDDDQDISAFVRNWIKSEWLLNLDNNGWSSNWDDRAISYLKKNL